MRLTPALTSAAATSVLVAGLLATAAPAPAQSPPASAAARPTAKTPDRGRQGRRGLHRRPGGQRGGAQGAQAGRQRRRCGRCGGSHARRDRALQRGHRGRRLLRLLRRQDRQGQHHRRSRDCPEEDAQRRLHRPGDGQALQLHPRAGHQRRQRRHSRHPGDLGAGPEEVRHAQSLADALEPAIKVATRGFKVDETFRQQTLDNEERFRAFRATKKLFLPKGDAPKVGSIFTNPELAATYTDLGERGTSAFYRGDLAKLMVDVVRKPAHQQGHRPPGAAGATSRAATSRSTRCSASRRPKVTYRGYDVYGMAPSSQRRLHGRRGAQHPRAHRLRREVARAGAAPLPRGQRAGLRRPRASTSATRASSTYPSRRC